MATKSTHSTADLILTASLFAKPGKMTEEDSSTASLKEILAQVQDFKLIKQDLAEPKYDLKQMQKKKKKLNMRINCLPIRQLLKAVIIFCINEFVI